MRTTAIGAAVASCLALAAPATASDVFYGCYPNLCRVRPDGSGKRQVTHDGTGASAYGGISATRAGRIGFSHGDADWVADRDARHRRRVKGAAGQMVLHPDDRHVMWFGGPTYPRWCHGTLAPRELTCHVLFMDSWTYPAWGPSRTLLTTDAATRQTICTTRIDTHHEAACRRVVLREHGSRYFYLSPSLAPDGRHLAAAVGDRDDAGTGIAVYDLDSGRRTRQLTGIDNEDTLPVWSPDGRYVAFVRSYKDGSWGAERVRATGGRVKTLARRKGGIYEVAWGG